MRRIQISAFISFLLLCIPIEGNISADNIPHNYGAKGALQDKNITLEEALHYAIQDEYLAQTRYDVVLEQFGRGIRPFSQLEYANKRNIQELYSMFRKHNIPIPRNNNDVVTFLTVPETIDEAFRAEMRYEINNISMYGKFVNRVDLPQDVKRLMSELRDASRTHLTQIKTEFNKY
ncbi:rubrerythrin [Salirhabdus euzebyi]|uniref:Rubrerythrin n=1 Tax=Salirhabdus euzebyi TaxID=394506 RepID=A0A841Q8P5_9BACI|nr:hypothetical protein [Salirhabdus euzebyi]MBB6454766.1 rubrerythrin [Salirhabdus euzebyi]